MASGNEGELLDRIQGLQEQLHALQLEYIALHRQAEGGNAITFGAGLSKHEVERYSRHLLLPEIGAAGQKKMLETSVLVVGAGGLSSTCALYLASSGIGRLGIIDFDEVEESNLHRQIIHTTFKKGQNKAESAKEAILNLNPDISVETFPVPLSRDNALDLFSKYDIVADCSDNLPTRYLVNDACVFSGKPLVSGSAIGFEGQVAVYNYDGGSCYRCLHAKPASARLTTNCSNYGVLGVGIIGCFQALEVLKIASGFAEPMSNKLLTFDSHDNSFLTIKIPGKNKNCAICGESNTITELIDYAQFCGSAPTDKIVTQNDLPDDLQVSVIEYKERESSGKHLLLDVRIENQFSICHLPNAINIPLYLLQKSTEQVEELIKSSVGNSLSVYCICRRGIDSQKAVKLLQDRGVSAKNISGGLQAWARFVDDKFPIY